MSGLISAPAAESVQGRDVDLPRRDMVVLAVDLVESVLPLHHGVLVKSLGDGLMARFDRAPDAVAAAAVMHQDLAIANTGLSPERCLRCVQAIDNNDRRGAAAPWRRESSDTLTMADGGWRMADGGWRPVGKCSVRQHG